MKLNYDLRNGMKVKVEDDWAIVYDEKGNEVYCENSNGGRYKKEYDEKGKVIHYKNSDGDWSKKEYNDKGNIIYYEDSNGYWFTKEFDEDGSEIYYENSNGKIIDKRPKPKPKLTKENILTLREHIQSINDILESVDLNDKE